MLNIVHISAKQHIIFRSACCSPKQKVKYFNVLFILFMKVCLQDMKANSIVMCYIRMHVYVYNVLNKNSILPYTKWKKIIAPNNLKYWRKRRGRRSSSNLNLFDCVILILKFHLVTRYASVWLLIWKKFRLKAFDSYLTLINADFKKGI